MKSLTQYPDAISSAALIKKYSVFLIILSAVFLLVFAIFAFAADGWKANDHDNDDPDDIWYIYAPNPITHDMWWYDYDNKTRCDWIYDYRMQWYSSAPGWFGDRQQLNLVHEIRADASVYEAHNVYYTNLPSVTHNEDSSWLEEQQDGYEEKEVGMDRPWELDVSKQYYLWTAWCPLNNGDTWFESESELTRPSPSTGDPWYPYHWDLLGKLWAVGAQ